MDSNESPITERTPDEKLDVLIELASRTSVQVDKLTERVEALESGERRTIDPSQRTPEEQAAWDRAHEGHIAAPEPEPEWERGPDGTAKFPAAPEEAKVRWRAQAEQVFQNYHNKLLAPSCVKWYGEHGPLWLAYYDHEWFMLLPYSYRQQMVSSVLDYAPVAGAKLGRDVLRASTEQQQAHAYSHALDVADKRQEGIVVGRDSE